MISLSHECPSKVKNKNLGLYLANILSNWKTSFKLLYALPENLNTFKFLKNSFSSFPVSFSFFNFMKVTKILKINIISSNKFNDLDKIILVSKIFYFIINILFISVKFLKHCM